jgi:hypothetical protein
VARCGAPSGKRRRFDPRLARGPRPRVPVLGVRDHLAAHRRRDHAAHRPAPPPILADLVELSPFPSAHSLPAPQNSRRTPTPPSSPGPASASTPYSSAHGSPPPHAPPGARWTAACSYPPHHPNSGRSPVAGRESAIRYEAGDPPALWAADRRADLRPAERTYQAGRHPDKTSVHGVRYGHPPGATVPTGRSHPPDGRGQHPHRRVVKPSRKPTLRISNRGRPDRRNAPDEPGSRRCLITESRRPRFRGRRE